MMFLAEEYSSLLLYLIFDAFTFNAVKVRI